MSDPAGEAPPRFVDVQIQTREGLRTGRMAVPPGSMTLAELAWNAMSLDDMLIDIDVRQEAKLGRVVSCRKGCGACCRQPVPLSPPEAWMLAALFRSWTKERRAAVVDRFLEVRHALLASDLTERLITPNLSDEESLQVAVDYFALGLPCPFLEDESCSIHPMRPAACREYLVTSPASFCSELGGNRIRMVPKSVYLSQALSRLTADLLGGESTMIPLPLALEWAEQNREDAAKTWDALYLMRSLLALLMPRPPDATGV